MREMKSLHSGGGGRDGLSVKPEICSMGFGTSGWPGSSAKMGPMSWKACLPIERRKRPVQRLPQLTDSLAATELTYSTESWTSHADDSPTTEPHAEDLPTEASSAV